MVAESCRQRNREASLACHPEQFPARLNRRLQFRERARLQCRQSGTDNRQGERDRVLVGILTVDQTARLLESAPAELVPYIAIGAFAGLRRAELERLDWKEVDLQSGLIEVTATKAKSARRRFVKIQPNLAKWLQPHAQLSGNVTPFGYRALLEAAREAAGIHQWPQNALRHSFASYHLARFNDAALLALELGHTNTNLVFQHYRQLVKPKQAERYWKIAPASRGRRIVAFAP